MEVSPVVLASARENARDWYLAALLAPHAARADLLAFAALAGEVHRVPLIVGDPTMGLVRLAWFRDALGAALSGELSESHVVDAAAHAARRRGVDASILMVLIDGAERALEQDGFADEAALSAYLEATAATPFRLAAYTLGDAITAEGDAPGLAGAALGRVRLALDLPLHLSHGRLPLPPDRLAHGDPLASGERPAREAAAKLVETLCQEAREAGGRLREAEFGSAFKAFLPLALLEPYLRALQRPERDPLRELTDVSPLTRLSRLLMARLLGRL